MLGELGVAFSAPLYHLPLGMVHRADVSRSQCKHNSVNCCCYYQSPMRETLGLSVEGVGRGNKGGAGTPVLAQVVPRQWKWSEGTHGIGDF